MSEPRQRCCAAVINGNIYVLGGIGRCDALKTVEVYDTHAEKWTKVKTKMNQCRCGAGAAYLEPVDAAPAFGTVDGKIPQSAWGPVYATTPADDRLRQCAW